MNFNKEILDVLVNLQQGRFLKTENGTSKRQNPTFRHSHDPIIKENINKIMQITAILTPDVRNMSRTFQDTIVLGICRKKTQQRVRAGGGGGEAEIPSHNTARQSSGEFSQVQTKPFQISRSFAGFHLVGTAIWFIVVT